MNGDVLSVMALALLAWLVVFQTLAMRHQHDADVQFRALEREAVSLAKTLGDAQAALLADWNAAMFESGEQLAAVAALRDEVAVLGERLRSDGAHIKESEAAVESRLAAERPSAAGGVPANSRKTDLMLEASAAWSDATRTVGALDDVQLSTRDASFQVSLRSQLFGVYSIVYRFAVYRESVAAWRALLQPYIEAMEKRYDRMLYNYI